MKFESQLAESVFRSKYLLEGETEPDQAVERIVQSVAKVYPEIESEAREYINKQWFIPAGGIWRAAGNPNKNVSHINCTTLTPVEDSLESIFDSLYKWAKYAAFGQGEGVDISLLRPKGAKVHNSSRASTGATSFMALYDAVLKVIAQQGRRGASLISIKDTHPDLIDFIHVKDKPESDKSRIDTANISIQMSDEFLKCVEEDKEWTLHFENKYELIESKVKAKDVFHQICHMAWKKGDPGLQFKDTASRNSNSDALGVPVVSTNACFGAKERLLTSKGYVDFATLEGSTPLIFSGDGLYREGKVFCSGEKDTIKLFTSSTKYSLTVTPDQVVRTTEGAMEAKDTLGKKLMLFDNNYTPILRDIPWVKLGFIQGDSSISRLKENSSHRGFELYIGKKDYDVLTLFENEVKDVYNDKVKNSYYIHDNDINNNLFKYGFDFSPLYKRELPTDLPAEKELSFLCGLFSANGYVTKKYRVGLKGTSKELMFGVSKLLDKHNISHYITTNKSKKIVFYNGEYITKESYDINIGTYEGLVKFYYLINFIQDYKRKDLYDLILQKSPTVTNIKKLGIQKVYDFSLPENNWGFVNNFLVHNCGEQYLDSENICDLSHINLAKMWEFGFEGFKRLVRFGIKFLNAVRINEINEDRSPTSFQKEKISLLPRTGLGVTGFADYLLDNKIPYGSADSINQAYFIFSNLAKYSYEMGYELALKYGSFPLYNKEAIKKSEFIKRLLDNNIIEEKILDAQFNVCYNTIAPVGSGSLISNTGGSGIEPLYSRYVVRRERATTKDWRDWFTFNAYVERYLKEQGLAVTKDNADKLTDPWWIMSFDVNPLDKIKLVAEAQKWIDSSISVTFNLPEEATEEDVQKVYMGAWKSGLKGVTVYREGSLTGVLITEKTYNKQQQIKDMETKEQPEDPNYRPSNLPCDIHITSYKGDKFIVLVGLKNDKPFEIFVSPLSFELDTSSHSKGIIEKIKSGHYMLKIQNGTTKVAIQNIGKKFDSSYASLSRIVSISLRYGTPVKEILKQLNREDTTFSSFEKVITRILKKYITNNEKVGAKCPDCSADLIFIDGCVSCSGSCGYSRCE